MRIYIKTSSEPIVLPDIAVGSSIMNEQTSYLERFLFNYKKKAYREFKLPAKLRCLEKLKTSCEPFVTYLDIMAGIGFSAKIFGSGIHSTLNEICPACVEVLKENFPGQKLTQENVFDASYKVEPHDLTFCDFNNFTFKRSESPEYAQLLSKVFEASRNVIINDCSIFYLNYGKTSYDTYSKLMGVRITNREEYFMALREDFKKRFGFYLYQVEGFKDTAFLLFGKKDLGHLEIGFIDKEDLDPTIIRTEE